MITGGIKQQSHFTYLQQSSVALYVPYLHNPVITLQKLLARNSELPLDDLLPLFLNVIVNQEKDVPFQRPFPDRGETLLLFFLNDCQLCFSNVHVRTCLRGAHHFCGLCVCVSAVFRRLTYFFCPFPIHSCHLMLEAWKRDSICTKCGKKSNLVDQQRVVEILRVIQICGFLVIEWTYHLYGYRVNALIQDDQHFGLQAELQ